MPSQLAGLLYKRLLVKYFEFYYNLNFKEPKVVNNQINQMQENFKPTKKRKENYNNERGIYFKNNKLLNYYQNDQLDNKLLSNNVNDFCFETVFQIGNH
jgi:hypothetical protein